MECNRDVLVARFDGDCFDSADRRLGGPRVSFSIAHRYFPERESGMDQSEYQCHQEMCSTFNVNLWNP
jgi:hypothetical protein